MRAVRNRFVNAINHIAVDKKKTMKVFGIKLSWRNADNTSSNRYKRDGVKWIFQQSYDEIHNTNNLFIIDYWHILPCFSCRSS